MKYGSKRIREIQGVFHLTPIPIGEDVSSLSAILMDEEFYHFTLSHSIMEDGLHLADIIGLMCLKMKAYLNLSEQEPAAHSSDIRKHIDRKSVV